MKIDFLFLKLMLEKVYRFLNIKVCLLNYVLVRNKNIKEINNNYSIDVNYLLI